VPKSGEQTRQALLDSANRIVQERGVENLTLDLIAQLAGVSKGGLLYHFPSKEALIKGMIQNYLDRFTSDFNTAAQQGNRQAPGRWTRAYLLTTFEDNQRSPRMSSGLLAAVATNPALLSPLQETFEKWVQQLDDDGIDPSVAQIIRLAVDGLWLVELFGLAPPSPGMREKIFQAINNLIDQHIQAEKL
jgi:AcrR family transcriptional regulator